MRTLDIPNGSEGGRNVTTLNHANARVFVSNCIFGFLSGRVTHDATALGTTCARKGIHHWTVNSLVFGVSEEAARLLRFTRLGLRLWIVIRRALAFFAGEIPK